MRERCIAFDICCPTLRAKFLKQWNENADSSLRVHSIYLPPCVECPLGGPQKGLDIAQKRQRKLLRKKTDKNKAEREEGSGFPSFSLVTTIPMKTSGSFPVFCGLAVIPLKTAYLEQFLVFRPRCLKPLAGE